VISFRQKETNMDMQAQKNATSARAADRLLPFAKARTFAGLSRSKIYKLLADGDFPAPAKAGRNNYFSELELQEWINAQLSARKGGAQ
jgi:predicted DNA-binding transcriptional regulator AlpA